MGERLVRRHPGEVGAAAERAAGCGEHQSLHVPRWLGGDQLVKRRVLGIDRDDARVGGLGERGDEVPSDHQALLVGEGEIDPLRESDDRRSEPGRPHHAVEHQVGAGGRDQLADSLLAGEDAAVPGPPGLPRRRRIAEGDGRHAVVTGLLDEARPAGARSEPRRSQLVRP